MKTAFALLFKVVALMFAGAVVYAIMLQHLTGQSVDYSIKRESHR